MAEPTVLIVTCVRLSDGKISVRVDEEEVTILPQKSECSFSDIESAMQKMVAEVVDAISDEFEPEEDEGW